MTNSQSLHRMDRLDKGTKQYGMRFNNATHDGTLFKTYELFITGIFHFQAVVYCSN